MRQAALLISHPGCLLASVLKIQLVLDPAQGALMSPQAEPPRKLRQQRGVTTALDPTRGHELFSVARVPTQCRYKGQERWLTSAPIYRPRSSMPMRVGLGIWAWVLVEGPTCTWGG